MNEKAPCQILIDEEREQEKKQLFNNFLRDQKSKINSKLSRMNT